MRKTLVLLLVASALALLVVYKLSAQHLFEYTMVDVNINTQGDAHLIEVPNGTVALIDAGYHSQAVKALVPLLKEKKITAIDYFFVSHAHRDHYEGAFDILDANINIKRLLVHRPPNLKSICEADCCCNYDSFFKLTELIPTTNLTVGQRINLSEKVWINISDLWKEGDSMRDINDTSIVMKLETSTCSILFAGDLNKKRSRRLLDNNDIQADILKVPHHGAESLAVTNFLKTVNADVFLVPSPTPLWQSDRSARTRNFATKNGIETFVNGLHGNVVVTGYADRYVVSGAEKRYESN